MLAAPVVCSPAPHWYPRATQVLLGSLSQAGHLRRRRWQARPLVATSILLKTLTPLSPGLGSKPCGL